MLSVYCYILAVGWISKSRQPSIYNSINDSKQYKVITVIWWVPWSVPHPQTRLLTSCWLFLANFQAGRRTADRIFCPWPAPFLRCPSWFPSSRPIFRSWTCPSPRTRPPRTQSHHWARPTWTVSSTSRFCRIFYTHCLHWDTGKQCGLSTIRYYSKKATRARTVCGTGAPGCTAAVPVVSSATSTQFTLSSRPWLSISGFAGLSASIADDLPQTTRHHYCVTAIISGWLGCRACHECLPHCLQFGEHCNSLQIIFQLFSSVMLTICSGLPGFSTGLLQEFPLWSIKSSVRPYSVPQSRCPPCVFLLKLVYMVSQYWKGLEAGSYWG